VLYSTISRWIRSDGALLLARKRLPVIGNVCSGLLLSFWFLTLSRNRLSNDKPSAIFRLRGTFSSLSASAAQNRFSSYSTELNPTQDVTAILGLSIEPLQQIQYQMASLTSGSGTMTSTKPDLAKDPTFLAERIVKHLFNYISGFLGDGLGPDVMVPMALVAKWYESFLGKVRAGGVGFLERGE